MNNIIAVYLTGKGCVLVADGLGYEKGQEIDIFIGNEFIFTTTILDIENRKDFAHIVHTGLIIDAFQSPDVKIFGNNLRVRHNKKHISCITERRLIIKREGKDGFNLRKGDFVSLEVNTDKEKNSHKTITGNIRLIGEAGIDLEPVSLEDYQRFYHKRVFIDTERILLCNILDINHVRRQEDL